MSIDLSKHVLTFVKIFILNVKSLNTSYRFIYNDCKDLKRFFKTRKLMTFEARQFSLRLRLAG